MLLDNWAMIYAQKVALEHNMPLYVCFALPEKFREATIRQYGFMLKGLQELQKVNSVFLFVVAAVVVGDSGVDDGVGDADVVEDVILI